MSQLNFICKAVVLTATVMLVSGTCVLGAEVGAPPGWTLQFEDDFSRAQLGQDWWASGLTSVEGGVLTVGREGDIGRNLVVCRREFKGAIRLEYDTMAPVDKPCDLSAILNCDESGYASGYFFGFGSQHNETGRFLLKGQPGKEYGATIAPHKWHHVVCERHGHRFRHIIDGEIMLDYTHPDSLPGPMYRQVGFYVWHVGRFDNVRVYTREEKVEVVEATQGSLPSAELVAEARAYPAPGKIGVSVDVPAIDGDPGHVTVSASLLPAGETRAVCHLRRVTTPNIREEMIFDAAELAPGDYVASITLIGPDGTDIGSATAQVHWPGRDEAFDGIKVLNNFVWELLNLRSEDTALVRRSHEFRVPCDRWLLIRTKAEVDEGGSVSVMLDSDDPGDAVSAHTAPGESALKAKRHVSAGEHSIHIAVKGDSRLAELGVWAIPDVQHSRYPTTVYHVKNGGEYDWQFISRHVLPSATTIITSGNPDKILQHVEEWKERGGRWIVYTSRPGLAGSGEIEQTADGLFEHFSGRPGFAHPLMSGVLVDEFYTRNDPAYPQYIEMVRRMTASDKFAGKAFYPYVAGSFGQDEGSVEFAKACIDGGGMICREAYLAEWPTKREALDYMRRCPGRFVLPFEDRLPGVTRHTVWVFGTFSFPWPFADGFPHVNYNAYLDMQFRMLANHPAFFGLGGVHIWRSGYTDEERLRWMARLFRHYCIEGKRRRFNSDPYLLKHIRNPDFLDGTEGWTVQAAEEDSVEARDRKGFGKLQGRYYRGHDTFLWTRRSADGPNLISQKITGLQIGRTYSIKLLTGDYGDLVAGRSRKEQHAVSVQLQGCELVEGPRYQYQQPYPSRARMGEFTRQRPFWINLHWHVFRATATSAVLRIADWQSMDDPVGPEGQELAFTYVEVKPYFGE